LPGPLEEELRIAVSEGLVAADAAASLGDEARRLGTTPLQLLRARGQISDATLAALEATRPPPGDAEVSPAEPFTLDPRYPFPAWERYQGGRLLGQGGMGQVFLAYDPRLRRNIALKVVRGDDPELARRFLAEARAQARVEHEAVCRIHEVGEHQGRSYIAMQLIDGLPLGKLAETLTVEQQALVLRDVALGVQAAHRAGLIHRDLKPANVMVERTADGRLKPYVMDFGVAHDWSAAGGTVTGAILGTPHYMSPEQARGAVSQLDRRADVYSLGATLYHLLTGELPISGQQALDVLASIPTVEPRPPRSIRPDLPRDLEAIVLKCLEKDRSARYDSALALAEDLDRFLSGEPVRARSAGLGYRLRKKVRKHRLAVAAAALAFLLVAAATGWAVATRRQAAQREQLARRFTEKVERIEALARYSSLSRLHDIRPDRAGLRRQMAELEEEMRQAGDAAAGPGSYALGRGFLALEDAPRARERLEAAWRLGYREPRVAWALALVLSQLYRRQLLEIPSVQDAARRQARREALEREYREPVLAYLRRSQGPEVPSREYLDALLAFHEDRFDDALARLDALGEKLPWFYESRLLRGDVLKGRAQQRWNRGDERGAQQDLDSARQVLTTAAAVAESSPAAHLALARLEYRVVEKELYSRGNLQPFAARGLEMLARSLQVDPDSSDALLWEARFYNRLGEQETARGGDPEPLLQKAVAATGRALQLRPGDGQILKELGQSLFLQASARQGRGLDPTELLRKAVQTLEAVPPGDRTYEYHSTLGLVFWTWSDHEAVSSAGPSDTGARAIESFRRATQIDPQVPDAWLNLGQIFLNRASSPRAADPEGDLEQARLALEKAAALNSRSFVTWFLAGSVRSELAASRRRRGEDPRPELAAAADCFQRGIDINGGVDLLHDGLGRVLRAQAREAWDRGEDPFSLLDQAETAYARAIAAAPGAGKGHNDLGEAYAMRAELKRWLGEDPSAEVRKAEAAYQEAAPLLPGLAVAWANLAKVRFLLAASDLERGRDPRPTAARAQEALAGAFQRNRDDASSWRYQGEVHAVLGRWLARRRSPEAEAKLQEAASGFERALELAPNNQDNRLAFGFFCVEWARARSEAGLDPAAPLERGLELANALLASRPSWPDARLLRASLLLARDPAHALADRDAALAANPRLANFWRSHAGAGQP